MSNSADNQADSDPPVDSDDEVLDLTDEVPEDSSSGPADETDSDDLSSSELPPTVRDTVPSMNELEEEFDLDADEEDVPSAAVVSPRGGGSEEKATVETDAPDPELHADDFPKDATEDERERAVFQTIQMEAIDRMAIEREGQMRQLEQTLPLLSARFAPEIVVRSPRVLVDEWHDGIPEDSPSTPSGEQPVQKPETDQAEVSNPGAEVEASGGRAKSSPSNPKPPTGEPNPTPKAGSPPVVESSPTPKAGSSRVVESNPTPKAGSPAVTEPDGNEKPQTAPPDEWRPPDSGSHPAPDVENGQPPKQGGPPKKGPPKKGPPETGPPKKGPPESGPPAEKGPPPEKGPPSGGPPKGGPPTEGPPPKADGGAKTNGKPRGKKSPPPKKRERSQTPKGPPNQGQVSKKPPPTADGLGDTIQEDSGGEVTVESTPGQKPPKTVEEPPKTPDDSKPAKKAKREQKAKAKKEQQKGRADGKQDEELNELVEELVEGEDEQEEEKSEQTERDDWVRRVFGELFLMTVPKNFKRRTEKEASFIEKSLELDQGDKILDLACGFGRHTVELAKRGHDVVGFDLSKPLLKKALMEAKRRSLEINFFHGDMRSLEFENAFEACYCWQSSFGYFGDRTDLDILARINRSLKSGGQFLLDVMNRDYVVREMPHRIWWEGTDCIFLEEGEFDYETNVMHMNRSFIYEDGRPPVEQDWYIRLYTLHELKRLFERTGFEVTEVSGSLHYRGYFLGHDSPQIIIRARKKRSVA